MILTQRAPDISSPAKEFLHDTYMNTQQMQRPQTPDPEQKQRGFFSRLFNRHPKSPRQQLEELQGRWGKLVRDAQELEQSCFAVQTSLLTADRSHDPEQANASMAEADRQLLRVSELLAVFNILRQKYRAPFQPGPRVLTQIKGTSQAALQLRQRREQYQHIAEDQAEHTVAEASEFTVGAPHVAVVAPRASSGRKIGRR